VCTTLCAQSSCQDELNTVNIELTNLKAQERIWEQEKKKSVDSLKVLRALRVEHQMISENYLGLKRNVTTGAGVTKSVIEDLESVRLQLFTLQSQKEVVEKQLKTTQIEADSLRKVKQEAKIVDDSIRLLQEELKDRIVVKSIESKTGRIFPDGIYLSNENHRYPGLDTALIYYYFDAALARVPFDLMKEKNKLLFTSVEKYKIRRICNLLKRYVPTCKLRLRVYYPVSASNMNMNPKKSAEFATTEFMTFLTTEYESLMNEIKVDIKYMENSTAKPHIEISIFN
jgi:hypothetical protein